MGGGEQIKLMKCQVKDEILCWEGKELADHVSLKTAVKAGKGTDENGRALISQ